MSEQQIADEVGKAKEKIREFAESLGVAQTPGEYAPSKHPAMTRDYQGEIEELVEQNQILHKRLRDYETTVRVLSKELARFIAEKELLP